MDNEDLITIKNLIFLASDCVLIPRVSGNCDKDERYRTISGVCNNLRHPEWGSVSQELNRILPPAYEVKFTVQKRLSKLF